MKTRRCEVGAHTKHRKNTHSKQINKVFQLTPPAIDVNRCFLLYFFVCLPHPLLEASSTFIYCCSLESHLDFFQILKGFSRLDIIETFLMRFIQNCCHLQNTISKYPTDEREGHIQHIDIRSGALFSFDFHGSSAKVCVCKFSGDIRTILSLILNCSILAY